MKASDIRPIIQHHFYVSGNLLQIAGFSGGWLIFNPDILIMTRARLLIDVEIKISRADFKRDFAKTKHQYFSQGIQTGVNYFYFACPKDLIKVEEVPAYAGLIYVSENGMRIIKKAKRLHQNKADEKLLLAIANSLSAKCIFGHSYFHEKRLERERL